MPASGLKTWGDNFPPQMSQIPKPSIYNHWWGDKLKAQGSQKLCHLIWLIKIFGFSYCNALNQNQILMLWVAWYFFPCTRRGQKTPISIFLLILCFTRSRMVLEMVHKRIIKVWLAQMIFVYLSIRSVCLRNLTILFCNIFNKLFFSFFIFKILSLTLGILFPD